MLESIIRLDQQTAIRELEGLAVAVALELFQESMRGTRIVIFTDNQRVQACLVKCKSRNDHVDLII